MNNLVLFPLLAYALLFVQVKERTIFDKLKF